jgi:hypothetical protein
MINIFSRVLVGVGVVLAVPVCQGMGTVSVDLPPTPVLMEKLGILVPDECDVQVYPTICQVGVSFPTSDIQQALSSMSVPEEYAVTSFPVFPGAVNCYVCIALPSTPILMQKLGVSIPEGYDVVINGGPVFEGHRTVRRMAPSTYNTHRTPCSKTEEKRKIMERPEMAEYVEPYKSYIWQWVVENFPKEDYRDFPKLRATVHKLIADSKGTEYELPKIERMSLTYLPFLLKYIADNKEGIYRVLCSRSAH